MAIEKKPWSSLDRRTQTRVAYRTARRESSRIEQYGPYVQGISVGLSAKESEGRVSNTICVRFAVKRKSKKIRKPNIKIPRTLPARVKLEDRLVQVQVPTDVEDLSGGREQHRNRIRATPRPDGSPTLHGAVACLVRDGNEWLYLMGCHHVIAFSAGTDNGRGLPNVDVFNQDGILVGRRARSAPFPEFGGSAIDAALARVLPSVDSNTVHDLLRRKIVSVSRKKASFPLRSRVKVLTPDGDTLAGFIEDHKNNGCTLPYNRGRFSVYFDELYVLHVDRPRTTLPGDSGSPVVVGGGILIGMHFWGNPGLNRSYMIPSYVLFRESTFGLNLQLA